jgi:Mrp family chromosome partitioning ATPase
MQGEMTVRAATGPASAVSERRPLSAFANPGPIVEAHFKPALEVDGFRWPVTCTDLIAKYPEHLQPALYTLLAADEAGRSLIGIAGPAAGVGCTTVLACLARLLAEHGKSVALVDGNFASPGLATQLGLSVDTGWEDVLAGTVPLAESVVYSLGDRIALLPLVAGGALAAEKLEAIHASVTAGVLRYHYDMVLFDLGAIGEGVQGSTARRIARQCRLDGVVLTSGISAPSTVHPQRLMQTAPELAAICLGVVENQLRAA